MRADRTCFKDVAPLRITTAASETPAWLTKGHWEEDLLVGCRTNIRIDLSVVLFLARMGKDHRKKIAITTMADSSKLTVDMVFGTTQYQSTNVHSGTGGLLPMGGQLHRMLTKDWRAKVVIPMKPCFDVYAFAASSGIAMNVDEDLVLSIGGI